MIHLMETDRDNLWVFFEARFIKEKRLICSQHVYVAASVHLPYPYIRF